MPEIQVLTDGPYLVDAESLTVTVRGGKTIQTPKGAKVALCRCGQSQSKPFCDGSHKSTGFAHDPSS